MTPTLLLRLEIIASGLPMRGFGQHRTAAFLEYMPKRGLIRDAWARRSPPDAGPDATPDSGIPEGSGPYCQFSRRG